MISTQTVTNNTMNAVIVAFPITVDENTAGKYSCQAIAIEGSTLPSFFNITGSDNEEFNLHTYIYNQECKIFCIYVHVLIYF